MAKRNRSPVVYKPEPRANGWAAVYAVYDESDTRRRGRGYGPTPAEASADAARRWYEDVELVRDILAGRRTRAGAGGPVSLMQATCDALPALAGGQRPKQRMTTARYMALYWCGWCPECGRTDVNAYRVVGAAARGQSGRSLSVERAGSGRCRCGGRLLGERPITSITTADVNGALAALRGQAGAKGRPMADATINRIRSAGAVVFGHAVDGRHLDRSPVDRSRRQKEGRKVIKVISGAELAALLGETDRKWRPMVAVMALSGLRLGEAQGLEVEDVELERGRIVVRRSRTGGTKSGHHRIVPILSSTLATALEMAEVDRPGGLVAGGIDPRKALARAAKAAGVAEPTRHGLRHFFTSATLALGAPVPMVQSWLGHSEIGVTDRYAHLLTPSAELRDLFDRIGPFVGRP